MGTYFTVGTIAAAIILVTTVAAENIDPGNDGSQYAYAENFGWINAEPNGNGGPGMHVWDYQVTGYLWGENVGWVSLSCSNTSSCGTVNYGVTNNGHGNLGGFAWGENVGWINFAPATAGVVIDAASGELTGHAWGENIGWISFASWGANPFSLYTAWTCFEMPPPSGSPDLVVDKSGTDAELSWGILAAATGYDIVEGDLGTLRGSGGDFAQATVACLSNHRTTTSVVHSDTPTTGEGFWFLVRGESCEGKGTYDTGGSWQVGLRDTEVAGSGNECP